MRESCPAVQAAEWLWHTQRRIGAGAHRYASPSMSKDEPATIDNEKSALPVAALAGAGANLILFSTGLGTPTGNPVAPVIKISSNSKTANSFHEYIDFDTGPVIDGCETGESIGEKLLNEVIEYASGNKKTKSTIQGRDDFLPWKRGMSL